MQVRGLITNYMYQVTLFHYATALLKSGLSLIFVSRLLHTPTITCLTSSFQYSHGCTSHIAYSVIPVVSSHVPFSPPVVTPLGTSIWYSWKWTLASRDAKLSRRVIVLRRFSCSQNDRVMAPWRSRWSSGLRWCRARSRVCTRMCWVGSK